MAFALVGSIGTSVQGTAGAAVSTLTWGTSETRAANNLLLCFCTVTGSATLPGTPSGWSVGAQVAGTSCSATVFYKIAAGSDAAPTIAAITSGLIAAHLEEWSGNATASPVDRAGTSTGTSSPTTATLAAANAVANELVAMAGADRRSVARATINTWTSNHGTPTLRVSNNSTSSVDHYSHATLISNSAAAADTAIQTLSITSSITGLAVAAVSFKMPSTATVTLPLLSSGGGAGSDYATTTLADSPYAYWRFGEPSGSTAVNAQGTSARDGTLVGGNAPPTMNQTGLLVGDSNTCFNFPNADFPAVQAAGVASIFSGTSSWSVETWINVTSDSSFRYIFDVETSANAQMAFLQHYDGGLYFSRRDAASAEDIVNPTPVLATGTHHVVATYDGANMKVYVDGSQYGSSTASTRSLATGTQFCIGNHASSLGIPVNGKMDEVAVYTSALSLGTIQAHYTAGTTTPAQGLFAPTVARSAQTVTLGLLDASAALYAPTLAPQPVTLTIPLLDGAAALYAPTLATRNLISLGLLDASAALYAPTLLGKNTLTVPLLDAAAALYAPTVAQTGGALQSLTLGFLSEDYPTLLRAASPTAYWRLGEPSGTSAADSSGNGNTGTYAGGNAPPTLGVPGLLANEFNTAASFTPLDFPLVQTDSVASLFNGTSSWSIAAWVQHTPDVGNFRYIFTAVGSFTNAAVSSEASYLFMGRNDSGGTDTLAFTPNPLADGRVHFVVATYDGSNMRLYCDGSQVGSATPSTKSEPSATKAGIGADANTFGVPFNGTIDEVAVFGSVLSGATISALYTAGAVAGLYGPTLAVVAITVSVPLLDGAAALYDPTVVRVGGGPQTLTLGLLDASATLYAPTVVPAPITLVVPFLDAAAATYAPSLLQAQFLTIPLLDASAALFAPTVIKAPYPITLGLLDGVAALYAPVLGQGLSLPLLDAAAALYAPTLTVGPVTVTLPQLDAVAATYAPTVASSSTLALPLLDGAAALYAPTVIQAQFVTLSLLDASAALYAPTLLGKNLLSLGLIDGAAALYAPTLLQAQFVTLPLLDGVATVYAPTLSTRNLLTIPLLDGAAALYAPTLLNKYLLTVPLLDAAATLSAPSVLATQSLTLPTIYGGLGAPSFVDEFDSGTSLNASVWNATYTGGDPGYGLDSHFMGDNRQVTVQSGYARMTAQRVGGTVTGVASTDVVTTNVAHNFAINDPVSFYSLAGGAGLANFDGANFAATTYYIKTTPSSTTFTLSATVGGATKDFTTNITSGSCRLPFDRKFKSASFGSNGTFSQRYGTWEARVRYPAGQGVFPAFWLIQPGTPTTPPETDIFEAFPGAPGGVGGSGTNYLSSGHNTSAGIYPADGHAYLEAGYDPTAPPYFFDPRGDLTLDWHIHTMVWTPYSIQMFIDGLTRGAAGDPRVAFTDPVRIALLPAMYPLFTFALGPGGYRVDDGATTPDTLTVDIDYIRVYAEAAGAVLFPPTVAAGPKMVTVPLLDGAATTYAPTLATKNTLTVPLLDASATLYAPTIKGTNLLTVPLLDGAAAQFAPALLQAQFVTLPLLDGGAATFAPTLLGKNQITLGLLDGAATTYAPAISQTIGLPLLDAAAALFAPTITTRNAITLGLLDASAALYAPSLFQAQFLTVPLLDAGAAVYAPSLATKNSLTVPLIDGAAALYDPAVLITGAQVFTLNAVIKKTQAGTAFTLDAQVIAQVIALPLLDADFPAPFLFKPFINQVQTSSFTVNAVLRKTQAGLFTLDAWIKGATQTVTLGLLDGAATTYAPTLLQAQFLTVPLLDASAAVYAPTLATKSTVALPLLDGAATTYAPSIGQTISLGLIDAVAAVYAPSLVTRYTITLPLLDGAATLYAPIVIRAGTGAGNFTVDAVIKRSQAASFTVDALLLRTAPRSFTADAVIRATIASSFTASAVVKRTATATFSVDAVLNRTRSSSFTVNAWIASGTVGGFALDAVILRKASVTVPIDAVIKKTSSGSFTISAFTQKTVAASFTIDAVVRATRTGGFTTDAVFLSHRSGSFSVAAVIRRTRTGSFTLNAQIVGANPTFTVDAWIQGIGQAAFTLDANISAVIAIGIAATTSAGMIAATASAHGMVATTSARTIAATAMKSYRPGHLASFAMDAEIT